MEVRTLLEDFLRFRESNYGWFRNLTLKDKQIEEMIDTGYNIPLPRKDKNGRQFVWHRTG